MGGGVDVGHKSAVGCELALAVAADECLAIGDKAVARLKSLEVAGLDFDGNVLESRDLVVFERVACTVAGHGAAVPRYGLAVGRGERLAVGGPGGQVKRCALVGVDGSHALVAAAVQAVVGGCTGHHVKSALVGLIAGIELARRSGGPCRLHFFTSPILGPRQASVAVGVLVGRRGRRILLVIGSLQGIIDGSLDGVGRDRGRSHGIDAVGAAGGLNLRGNTLYPTAARDSEVHLLVVVVTKGVVICNVHLSNLAAGNGDGDVDVVGFGIPLVALVVWIVGIGHGFARVGSVSNLGQVVRGARRRVLAARIGCEEVRLFALDGDRRVVGSFGAGLRHGCRNCGGRGHGGHHGGNHGCAACVAAKGVKMPQHSVLFLHIASFIRGFTSDANLLSRVRAPVSA